MHQAMAILSAYSIWCHLPLTPPLSRYYIYIFAATFLLILLLQCGFIIYRNILLVHGCTRVSITNIENIIIKIKLYLRRPLRVDIRKYIYLYISKISFSLFI